MLLTGGSFNREARRPGPTLPRPDSTVPDAAAPSPPRRSILITAGPTHEPIDSVRYLANRSSGRLGIALAEAAAARGWAVTLLLGPVARSCDDTRVRVVRFRTTADLEALLAEHFPACDVLIQAAAIADYRPKASGIGNRASAKPDESPFSGVKIKRGERPLTIELEPTPDLVAACAVRRKPGQAIVGFALEPRERMIESATDKLARKGLDLVVANPLETMDAEGIDAVVLDRAGGRFETGGPWTKDRFAAWLIERVETLAPGLPRAAERRPET